MVSCSVWMFLWRFARFGGILCEFAALPVSSQCLQLLAFITIQPGTDGTLAPTDKISLAPLAQAVSLTAAYYTGNTWRGICGESYRFYKNVVTVLILILYETLENDLSILLPLLRSSPSVFVSPPPFSHILYIYTGISFSFPTYQSFLWTRTRSRRIRRTRRFSRAGLAAGRCPWACLYTLDYCEETVLFQFVWKKWTLAHFIPSLFITSNLK